MAKDETKKDTPFPVYTVMLSCKLYAQYLYTKKLDKDNFGIMKFQIKQHYNAISEVIITKYSTASKILVLFILKL